MNANAAKSNATANPPVNDAAGNRSYASTRTGRDLTRVTSSMSIPSFDIPYWLLTKEGYNSTYGANVRYAGADLCALGCGLCALATWCLAAGAGSGAGVPSGFVGEGGDVSGSYDLGVWV
jgi:hypothetical protein